MMNHEKWIKRAIGNSRAALDYPDRYGPFGAVIIKNDIFIADGYNTVVNVYDPTAHAEINAIRNACCRLKTYDLSGCSIYCSCHPCPMCMGAILWAKISNVYYAAEEPYGFSDTDYWAEMYWIGPMQQPSLLKEYEQINDWGEAENVITQWFEKENRREY